MLGYFVASLVNAVCVRPFSFPFSRGRSIVLHSPSLSTVRFSFSWHPVGSRLPRLVPRTGPPLSPPFFLLLGTRPQTRLPCRAHPLISSPLFPIRSLVQGAHHGRVYLHSMTRLCTSPMLPPLLVCCAPPPFATIKYPWSLFFFFILIPLALGAELRDPVAIVK